MTKTTQPDEQPQGLHSDWWLLYFCRLPRLPGQCEGAHLGKGPYSESLNVPKHVSLMCLNFDGRQNIKLPPPDEPKPTTSPHKGNLCSLLW